jgi:hypothetical protein
VPLTDVGGRVPVPDSLAPDDTVTLLLLAMDPFTRNSPAEMVVAPA